MAIGIVKWARASLAVLAAAGVLWLAAPAHAAADLLDTWEPSRVQPADWEPQEMGTPEPYDGGTFTCPGAARAWMAPSDGTYLALIWWTCDSSDLTSVAAQVYSIGRAQSGIWSTAGNVLDEPTAIASVNPTDVVEPLNGGHRRLWVEDNRLVVVFLRCPAQDDAECLTRSADAIRDISDTLPGAPVNLAGDSSQRSASLFSGLALLWLVALGIVAAVRRLARTRYATNVDHPLWRRVEEEAGMRRRRRRLRRIGFLLVAPVVVSGVVAALQVALGVFSPLWWIYLAVWAVLLGLPGVLMLVLSRDPKGRAWRGPGRVGGVRGVASLLLALGSSAYLLLLVVVLSLSFNTLTPLPIPLDALAQMAFILLLSLAWPIGVLLRRQAVADAWRVLNRRSGPPLVYVRTARVDAKLRADPGPPLGLLSWVAGHLVPARRQPFEQVLMRQLANHSPVAIVQSDAVRRATARSQPLGPRVLGLPPVDWHAAHSAAMNGAQGIVVVADHAQTHEDVEILRASLRAAADKPLIVVLPPLQPAALRQRWEALRQAMATEAVFADLDPALIASGTQVAARMPGRGWLAYGAPYRDEWTLSEAVREAVLSAREGSVMHAGILDVAALRATVAPSARQGPVVQVLSAVADSAIGAEVARELTGMGVGAEAVTAGSPSTGDPGGTFVVILSAAALHDPAWRSELDRRHDLKQRPVGVRIGGVNPGEAPEFLRSLQLIEWRESNRAGSIAEIFVGIAANPDLFKRHRDLHVQARAWTESGRDASLLITDVQAARKDLFYLADAAHDPLARPGALLHDFVTASLSRASGRRRRRRALQAVGVAALVLAVVAVSGIFVFRSSVRLANLLTNQIIAAPLVTDRPDITALRSGALMIQGTDAQAAIARRELVAALNHTWAPASIGAAHDSAITDAVIVSSAVGEEMVLTTDDAGTLSRWDIRTGGVQWRRAFLSSGSARLAATPDGSVVAIGQGETVHIVRAAPWSRSTVTLPDEAKRVAVSADGATVVAATVTGQIAVTAVGGQPAVRVVEETFDDVLSVRATGGDRVTALVVRSSGQLAVLELPSGDTVAEFAAPTGTPGGTISPDGSTFVVTGADRELRIGVIGAALRPVGQAHDSRVYGLALLDSRQLVITSPGFGVQVIDTQTGLITARLIPGQAGAALVRGSPDGRYLLTSSGYGLYVWPTEGLGPSDQQPAADRLGEAASLTDGDLVINGNDAGLVVVARSGRALLRSAVVAGSVTVVAADGDQILVGSDLGEVAQVDLPSRTVTRRWNVPSGGPVTALGWSPDHERLVVGSARAMWWSVDACDGCGTDSGLLDELRSRIWSCFRDEGLSSYTEQTRQRLGLHLCQASPAAQEG